MTTRQEAEKCASSAPPAAFGLIGVLTVIEIIYYSFELWKNCHPAPATAKAEIVGDPPHIMIRRARRSVIKSGRHHGRSPQEFDVDTATAHMLKHVYHSDDSVIVACYCDATPDDVAALVLES